MFGWLGQLKALWDLARQIVNLRDEVEAIVEKVNELINEIKRIDERTRKQVYREKTADASALQPLQRQVADPQVDRTDILRAARQKGVI